MFCPKCGAILIVKKDSDKIGCSCGYQARNVKNIIIKEKVAPAKKIEVIDKTIETLPKTDIKCPKCGHDKAYYWLVQTRASDEGDTQFFRCVKCNHYWRSYK